MSKFFINRPIVAMVISILMVIMGVVAMARLPIALFPRALQDGWRNDQARDCSERTIFANKGQACLRASLDILQERE